MDEKNYNPYKKLGEVEAETASTNPYASLDKTDVVGTKLAPTAGKTNFRRIEEATEAKEASDAEFKKESSFSTTLRRTAFGIPKGVYDLAKQVVQDPLESAKQAALGISNGLTLGATDYLQRKAFIKAFQEGGFDEEQANQVAEKILKPDDRELSAIRGGANFAGIVAPYAAAEQVMISGIRYAAPLWAAKHAKLAMTLANLGAWVPAGQLEESLKPEDERSRGKRAVIDTALSVAFPQAGAIYRRIRGTAFNSPFTMNPTGTGTQALIPAGEKVTADALITGAQKRIAELEGKETISQFERNQLDFLKKNSDNADALFKYQESSPVDPAISSNRGDATVSITIEKPAGSGATAEAAVEGVENTAKGTKITVATNDAKSLQNYIKGSNDIDYKIVDDLGVDALGNKIAARHEFNAKLGRHTIFATDQTTASNLAHELGHYFDNKLAANASKLSKLIPDFEKNREALEDALGSFAVERLGGQGTSEAISAQVSAIVEAIMKEADSLSQSRRGSLVDSGSERFADAVSEILTKPGAAGQSPTLTALLRHSEKVSDQKLFAEQISKALERPIDAPQIASEKTLAGGNERKRLSQKKLFEAETKAGNLPKDAKPDTKIPVYKSGTDEIKEGNAVRLVKGEGDVVTKEVPVKDLVKSDGGEYFYAPKEAAKKPKKAATVESRVKELERTPTGKKPDTPAFRAEKITNDQNAEVFMNTKVLPKVTGEQRIGKSNADIITRSYASKMTESDFNNILKERFGNLSEDIVKAKRILTDNAAALSDKLAGREIADLSGQELKDIMSDYNRLAETFEVFAGVRTELSNSFRSLGISVNPGENDILRSALEAVQKAIGNEKDPFKIAQKAAQLRTLGPVEKYFEIWYPTLLSGPKTSARNITGNLSNLAAQTVSNLFTRKGQREFIPRVFAIIDAHKSGMNLAGKVFRGEENILSKFYEPAVPKEKFAGKFEFLNKLEYVGRFLSAQDAYFSNAFKESEIAATRVGNYTYGLADKGAIDALNDGVATFMAQQGTYRNAFEKTAVGEVASKVAALKTSTIPGVQAFGNFIFPFVKTVANITDRRIDFVPFLNTFRTFAGRDLYVQRANRILKAASVEDKIFEGAVAKGMTADEAKKFAKGEASRVSEIVIDRLRNQQMGRFYMGMAVTAAGAPLALSGRITGSGPKGKNERAVLMKTGWRPNSIIMPNGVALPYQQLALPLSSVLSILGNINDAIKYSKDDLALTDKFFEGMKGFVRSELDQSFLSGLSSLYEGLYGYKTYKQVISEFAANAVPIPAAWTQTKDIIFPERYEAKTFNEQIKNKLGITGDFFGSGLTEPLQPRLDAFGDQQKADLVWGLTPPILNSTKNDPVLEFMKEKGVFIGKPQKSTKVKNRQGESRKITPEEYTKYVEESGKDIYEELKRKVESGYFDRFDTKEEIDKEIQKISKEAKAKQKKKIDY